MKQSDLEEQQNSDFFADIIETLLSYNQALQVYGSPRLLPLVSMIAERYPSLNIVIDHFASCWPDEALDCSPWLHHMRRAGAHPNVVCKMSGPLELQYRGNENGRLDQSRTRKMIEEVLASFAVSRLIFGSNWPVNLKYGPPMGNQTQVEMGLESLSNSEIKMIFAENATRIFNLEHREKV